MRRSRLRWRFWAENALALIATLLAITTVAQPAWVEAVFGVDPDASSGALEWSLVVIAAGVAIVSAWLARLEWRHAQRPLRS